MQQTNLEDMYDFSETIEKFQSCNQVLEIQQDRDILFIDFNYYGKGFTATCTNNDTATIHTVAGVVDNRPDVLEYGVVELDNLYKMLMSMPDLRNILIDEDRIVH